MTKKVLHIPGDGDEGTWKEWRGNKITEVIYLAWTRETMTE
jgi:hypothetical protein